MAKKIAGVFHRLVRRIFDELQRIFSCELTYLCAGKRKQRAANSSRTRWNAFETREACTTAEVHQQCFCIVICMMRGEQPCGMLLFALPFIQNIVEPSISKFPCGLLDGEFV